MFYKEVIRLNERLEHQKTFAVNLAFIIKAKKPSKLTAFFIRTNINQEVYFLRFSINSSNKYDESCGPGLASGWY